MRKNIPREVQFKIWKRDFWTCRYCEKPVFFSPVLKLLNEMSPDHGYYHPNGKTNKILELFQWSWASVDHIIPVSKEGTNDEENFVTACWKCNLKFKNLLPEQGKPKPLEISIKSKMVDWDGFSSIYLKLVNEKDDWAKIIAKTNKG